VQKNVLALFFVLYKYCHPHCGIPLVQCNNRYDLMVACKEIGLGIRHVPELLGDVVIDPITTAGAYDKKLESKRVQNEELLGLLRRYTNRKAFSA